MTTSYVASDAEDFIALVPTVLRFEPEDSVVVMTFGPSGHSFHARVDLPRRPREQDEVADIILKAIKTNKARTCAVLIYSHERPVAAAQGRKLNRKLRRSGIRVVDVIQVDGSRYFRVLQGDIKGTAFDLDQHPFTPRRKAEGVVVHKSRADLAATLIPSAEDLEKHEELAQNSATWLTGKRDPVAEASWVCATIESSLARGALTPSDLPRMLADLLDPELADVAWAQITRANARDHLEVWRDVVRRSPSDFVDAPACLLAFSAWMAGDGALAWCGLDRCRPGALPMADMLTRLLHCAVSPTLWPGLSAQELTALRGPAA